VERTIDLVLGASGAVVPNVVPPLTDICWNFGYATEQWTVLAALFGGGSRDIVLQPQYTSTNENAFNPTRRARRGSSASRTARRPRAAR
jgi:hypothetical protein